MGLVKFCMPNTYILSFTRERSGSKLLFGISTPEIPLVEIWENLKIQKLPSLKMFLEYFFCMKVPAVPMWHRTKIAVVLVQNLDRYDILRSFLDFIRSILVV